MDLLLTLLVTQVAFPMSVNVGNKPGRVRSNTHEVNLHGSPLNLGNCKPSSGKETVSKESD